MDPVGGNPSDSPEAPNGADFDRLKDVEIEAANAGGPSLHGTVSPPAKDRLAAANPTGALGEAEADALKYSLLDAGAVVVVESTSRNTSAEVEESGAGAGLAVVEDASLKSVEACLEIEVDESVEVAVGDDEGQLLLEAMMTNFTGLIDDVDAGVIPAQSCAASGGQLQNSKTCEDSKQLDVGIEDGDPVRNSDHSQNDGAGFEEGEIEGEFQNLGSEESGESKLGDEDAEDEKSEGSSICRGSGASKPCDHGTRFGDLHSIPEIMGNHHHTLNRDATARGDAPAARAQAVSYDEVVDWNETPLPDNEVSNTSLLFINQYWLQILLFIAFSVYSFISSSFTE